MQKKLPVLIVLAIVSLTTIRAQYFHEFYGDTAGWNEYISNDVVQHPDGGFFMVGSWWTQSVGTADAYMIRTNGAGDTLFTKRFATVGSTFNSIELAVNGNLMVLGSLNGDHLFLIDTLGNIIWNQNYTQLAAYQWTMRMVKNSAGNYVLVGDSSNIGDFIVIEVDPSGNQLWSTTIAIPNTTCRPKEIKQTSDGGYFIAGTANDQINGWSKLYVKLDVNGDIDWIQTPVFPNTWAYTGDCVALPNNEVAVVWNDSANCVLTKLDSTGAVIWNKTYNNGQIMGGDVITTTPSGGFVLAGTYVPTPGQYDMYLMITDNVGDSIRTSTFSSCTALQGLYPFEIIPTSGGGYAITGQCGPLSVPSIITLVKTDPWGYLNTEAYSSFDSLERIDAFPNPSKGILNMDVKSNSQIELIDLLGNTVLIYQGVSGSQQLDMSSLPNGVYLLRVGQATRKIVLAR